MKASPRPEKHRYSKLGLGVLYALLVNSSAFAAAENILVPNSIAHTQLSIVYPLMGTRVTSGFGDRIHPLKRITKHHNGVDLAAPEQASIRAIKNGTVIFADPMGSYGNLVVVQHKNGLTSHYGHCHEIKVQPGDKVKAGAVIATVGSTGGVTGPHLHFELRSNGEPLNPDDYIKSLSGAAEG